MYSKKLNVGSKDIINSLPEALIYHILSFLSTKEAALTSLLSRKWRYLFAFVPNLDFDDPVRMQPDMANQEETEIHTSFMDFVDRVLALRGNFPVNTFSLKCGNGVDDVGATRWILNMLERRVSDLDLRIALDRNYLFPSKVFVSKSLVRLRIGARNGLAVESLIIEVGDVSLPKLKTLCLDSVVLNYQTICLAKLLSGCHVLEELVLTNLCWDFWESCSVSIPTLKRLTCCIQEDWINPPPSVTFDNPALVYFEYTDTVALKYEKVNFDSLVEARLGLRVGYEETENQIEFPDGIPFPFIEYVTVGDATDLLMGLRNVQVLYLYASTVEVLTFCCKAIPTFNNLTHLTIESNTKIGWESLPNLLKNCPNLKTLVFQGLLHKATIRCGDVCPCKPPENIPTCLSSSPVKVLKILKFGETNDKSHKTELEQIKHFLELMPHLEQLNIYYDTSVDDNLVKVSKQLQEISGVASAKCKVQVISDNLTLSVTLPSSSSI